MNNGKITKDNNKLTKTKTTNNNSKKPSSKHLMTGTAIFIAAILVISGTNIKAFADFVNVVNAVNVSISQVTITEGESATVFYSISPSAASGGQDPTDPSPGCNAKSASQPGGPATLTIGALPAGVTVTGFPLTYTDCTSQSVKFSASTAGTYQIPKVTVTDTGAGTYNTEGSDFTLQVNAAPVTNQKPTITVPSNIGPVEGNTLNGANVPFTVTASDPEDGDLTNVPNAISCSHQSGGFFPLGTTTVSCTATDSGQLSDTKTFTVTVQDKTPPTIQNVPADMVVGAQNSGGATVTYNKPTATDIVDPSVDVTCTPASGQNLPIGITTVKCDASDDSGNPAQQATFEVTVNIPSVQFPLAPVNPDGSSTYKKGSTIPFKIGAQYAGGEQASDLAISLALLKVGPAQIEPVNEIVSTSAATTGSLFRWDSTSQQFIYNLSTKTLEPGLYKAYATVNGFGIVQSVEFNLRK